MNRRDAETQSNAEKNLNEISGCIIGAAIEVHKQLGAGLLESVYEECLVEELKISGLNVERQKRLPIYYKERRVKEDLRLDLLVESEVVVEIKAVDKLLPIHEAQLMTYMKLTQSSLGLLINFNERTLKQGIRRKVMNFNEEQNPLRFSASPRLCGEEKSANTVTEQMTKAGQAIEHSSFAIVDAEAGDKGSYTDEQWPLVRRMIHATADFEFNGLTEFHPDAMQAGLEAIAAGAPIVADVEMICVGLSKPRLSHFGVKTHQFISDEDVISDAKAQGTTRAVQAMRKAHKLGLLDGAIVGVGNAPTALLEVIRLIEEEGAKPALIVGMPVGFVSAKESKDAVAAANQVPWVITRGRKGGSTLVVSAIHAMLALAEAREKHV